MVRYGRHTGLAEQVQGARCGRGGGGTRAHHDGGDGNGADSGDDKLATGIHAGVHLGYSRRTDISTSRISAIANCLIV